MKTIKIVNGEIRHGFEFQDLSEEAQERVLSELIDFEIRTMNEDSPFFYLATRMVFMNTPWLLGAEIYNKHKQDLIESIEINMYLFDEDGAMLPIIHYMDGDRITRTTFGKQNYGCVIEDLI